MKRYITIILASLLCLTALAQLQPKEGFTIHTVKWFEDLAGISAGYGVPEDVIMTVNGLKSKELKTRQMLYIPVSEKYWPSSTAIAEATAASASGSSTAQVSDTQASDKQNDEVSDSCFFEPVITGKVKLGLLLPMKDKRGNVQGNNLDFYTGVLMAVKDLGEEGIDISLNVYDLSKGLGDNLMIERNDFILGPIRSDDVSNALESFGSRTLIVSPLDQHAEKLVYMYPNLVQAPTGQSEQYYAAIGDDDSKLKDNYIIVTSKVDTIAFREASEALMKEHIPFKKCYCDVSNDIQGWNYAYKAGVDNRVILAITNEAILNNAIRNIGIYNESGDIISFCNSKVRSYSTIPVENIHRAGIRALCTYYIDYSDSRTLSFIHKYRALCKTEPSQFAFQGYDLCYFMCKTWAEYGWKWRNEVVNLPEMSMLQAKFKFKRIENGGLLNYGVKTITFNSDYSVSVD